MPLKTMTLKRGLLLLVLAFCAVPCQARENAQYGWEIDYSSSLVDSIILKFNARGLFLRLKKIHVTMIGNAPSWDCFIYNDLNNRFMRMDNNQWKTKLTGRLLKYQNAKPVKVEPFETGKSEVIDENPATQILLREKVKDGKFVDNSEVWVCKQINTPSNFKQLVNIALNLPNDFSGTPLRISTIEKTPFSSRRFQVLDASRIKRLPFNSQDFQPLAGYQEVTNTKDLMSAN